MSRFRVYITDATTNKELGTGIWHATGANVNGVKGTADDVVITPIGNTPKDIGEQAFQGEYGFPARCRAIKACHFPGRTIKVKIWHLEGSEYRTLA